MKLTRMLNLLPNGTQLFKSSMGWMITYTPGADGTTWPLPCKIEDSNLEQVTQAMLDYLNIRVPLPVVNPDLLDDRVLNDIMENMDTEDPEQLRLLSVSEAFNSYCTWNGLNGWSDKLAEALHSIEESAP